MKYVLALLLFSFCKFYAFSQSSILSKKRIDSNTIVYFIPNEVEILLVNKIEKDTGVYFELSSEGGDNFKISIFSATNVGDQWSKMTNRMIYIGKKFYPLIFDYDRMFASSDKGDEILKKSFTEEYIEYGRSLTIHHYFYYVEFRRSGVVINSGYEGLKPPK